METAPVTPVVTATAGTPAPGIFGTRMPASIAYIIGILLFFMPFIEIKCGNAVIYQIKGTQLATGFDLNSSKPKSDFSFGEMSPQTDKKSSGEKKDPNIFALVALCLGVAGLLVSFIAARSGGLFGLIIGCLAAISMITMMVKINADISQETGGEGLSGQSIGVNFTLWFYISVLSFILAAYFSFRRWKYGSAINTIPI